MRRFAMPALVMLALASGCGSSADGGADPVASSSTAPSAATSAATACPYLTQEQAETVAGGPLGPVTTEVGAPFKRCRWTSADLERAVVVQTAPGSIWARELPAAIAALKAAGLATDAKTLEKLDAGLKIIESGKDVTDQQACDLFSQMLEIQGLQPGSTEIVNLIPNAQNVQGATALSCQDGTFASVAIQATGLSDSPEILTRMETALDQTRKAA